MPEEGKTMFEVITPGGPAAGSAAPEKSTSGHNPSTEAPAASANTVSLEEAIKGGEGAKMNTFSVSDLSKGSAGAGTGPNPAGGGLPGSSVSLGGMVQGKLVVDLMDALLPSIFVLLFHRFGLSVRKSQMQLVQSEKNTLAPIVDACLNSINLDFSNPWSALAVTIIVIYGGKALEVGGTGWLDKKTAESKPFQPAPIAQMKQPAAPAAKAPEPIIEKPNTDTTSFHEDGPRTWTQADVEAVVRKRKCSKVKAVEWLEKNWAKKGGVI